MIKEISHSRPYLGRKEIDACVRVVKSNQLSQGEQTLALERELSAIAGHRFGCAVSSGTAALFCALKALGAGPGDAVIIPSYCCTALLNAVHFTGAKPVLSDVDPFTGNIAAEYARAVLSKKVKAIIAPHMFGYPADIADIARLGVPVIEDCAQCIGASINGRRAGALSTIAVFSFYSTKMIGAGEGGLVATSDRSLARACVNLREYDNRESYAPSFNFKLSDIHAAIARIQLSGIDAIIGKRLALARRYGRLLENMSSHIEAPSCEQNVDPVYFRYVVQCREPGARDRIIKKMGKRGVACRRPVYKPLHHYLKLPGFPWTDALFDRALSLPIYPGLTGRDIDYISGQLAEVLDSL